MFVDIILLVIFIAVILAGIGWLFGIGPFKKAKTTEPALEIGTRQTEEVKTKEPKTAIDSKMTTEEVRTTEMTSGVDTGRTEEAKTAVINKLIGFIPKNDNQYYETQSSKFRSALQKGSVNATELQMCLQFLQQKALCLKQDKELPGFYPNGANAPTIQYDVLIKILCELVDANATNKKIDSKVGNRRFSAEGVDGQPSGLNDLNSQGHTQLNWTVKHTTSLQEVITLFKQSKAERASPEISQPSEQEQQFVTRLAESELIKQVKVDRETLQKWVGDCTQEEAKRFVDFCANWKNDKKQGSTVPSRQELATELERMHFNNVRFRMMRKWLEDQEHSIVIGGIAPDQEITVDNSKTKLSAYRAELPDDPINDPKHGVKLNFKTEFANGQGGKKEFTQKVLGAQGHLLGCGIGYEQNSVLWHFRHHLTNEEVNALFAEHPNKVSCGEIAHGTTPNQNVWRVWGANVGNVYNETNEAGQAAQGIAFTPSNKISIDTAFGVDTMPKETVTSALDNVTEQRQQFNLKAIKERNAQLLKNQRGAAPNLGAQANGNAANTNRPHQGIANPQNPQTRASNDIENDVVGGIAECGADAASAWRKTAQYANYVQNSSSKQHHRDRKNNSQARDSIPTNPEFFALASNETMMKQLLIHGCFDEQGTMQEFLQPRCGAGVKSFSNFVGFLCPMPQGIMAHDMHSQNLTLDQIAALGTEWRRQMIEDFLKNFILALDTVYREAPSKLPNGATTKQVHADLCAMTRILQFTALMGQIELEATDRSSESWMNLHVQARIAVDNMFVDKKERNSNTLVDLTSQRKIQDEQNYKQHYQEKDVHMGDGKKNSGTRQFWINSGTEVLTFLRKTQELKNAAKHYTKPTQNTRSVQAQSPTTSNSSVVGGSSVGASASMAGSGNTLRAATAVKRPIKANLGTYYFCLPNNKQNKTTTIKVTDKHQIVYFGDYSFTWNDVKGYEPSKADSSLTVNSDGSLTLSVSDAHARFTTEKQHSQSGKLAPANKQYIAGNIILTVSSDRLTITCKEYPNNSYNWNADKDQYVGATSNNTKDYLVFNSTDNLLKGTMSGNAITLQEKKIAATYQGASAGGAASPPSTKVLTGDIYEHKEKNSKTYKVVIAKDKKTAKASQDANAGGAAQPPSTKVLTGDIYEHKEKDSKTYKVVIAKDKKTAWYVDPKGNAMELKKYDENLPEHKDLDFQAIGGILLKKVLDSQKTIYLSEDNQIALNIIRNEILIYKNSMTIMRLPLSTRQAQEVTAPLVPVGQIQLPLPS